MTEVLLKRFYLFIIACNISIFSFGQNCDIFTTDIQGNSYTSVKNEVIKKDNSGLELFRFSNKLIGNLFSMDVTNPMRPIFFYKEAQKLVITDNTLSEQNKTVIPLEQQGYYQISCVAASRIDNGIWLYDQDLMQIIKLNQHFKKVIETGNLKQLLTLENLNPIKMMEANGYLYIQCSNNGILVFDIYGTYYKAIPIKNIEVWNIQNNQIFFSAGNIAQTFNLTTLEIETLSIKPAQEGSTPIWIDNQMIYYCFDSKIISSKFIAP